MAKTWYPVVDYSSCLECGTCVDFCSHNVYDKAKSPSPVVTAPISCVDHCHGCGNKCPVGAISYVGDNTGWMPPNGAATKDPAQCSCAGQMKETAACSCGNIPEKKV